ncbi:extensin-like domain-containing protein [Roseivivax sp. CAU 1761]
MTRSLLALTLAALSLAPALHAAAPDSALRPVARPEAAPVARFASDGLEAGRRPEARPEAFRSALAAKLAQSMAAPAAAAGASAPGELSARGFAAAASSLAVAAAPRPQRREGGQLHQAMARQVERAGNGLCGDPSIEGEPVGFVPGKLPACGVDDAVRVRAVGGVRLSQAALMDCTTARALKSWVQGGVKPAVGRAGGGVAELRVAAHYACRTRNNQPGAKVSEHGKGRAIDISAIRLRDGTDLTVLGGYRAAGQGPILQRMYRAACGPFGTTLGPDSDRYHQDHFHFDTARHRGGSFCQ